MSFNFHPEHLFKKYSTTLKLVWISPQCKYWIVKSLDTWGKWSTGCKIRTPVRLQGKSSYCVCWFIEQDNSFFCKQFHIYSATIYEDFKPYLIKRFCIMLLWSLVRIKIIYIWKRSHFLIYILCLNRMRYSPWNKSET